MIGSECVMAATKVTISEGFFYVSTIVLALGGAFESGDETSNVVSG